MVSRPAAAPASARSVLCVPGQPRTWSCAIHEWLDLTGQGHDDLAELIGVGEEALRAWGAAGPRLQEHTLALAVVLLAEGISPPDDGRLPPIIASSPAPRRGVLVRVERRDGHTLPHLDEISVSMHRIGLRVAAAQPR